MEGPHGWEVPVGSLRPAAADEKNNGQAGFALSSFRIKGKKILSTYILLADVFPPFILILALYGMISTLGLNDHLVGLAILHLILVVPYCTWMLRGYFLTVPRELREAALIDGCTRSQSLFRVILPVTAPGVASAAIFSLRAVQINRDEGGPSLQQMLPHLRRVQGRKNLVAWGRFSQEEVDFLGEHLDPGGLYIMTVAETPAEAAAVHPPG